MVRDAAKNRPLAKRTEESSGHIDTPLHIAALEGNLGAIVNLLSQNQHDINGYGHRKFTPLHFAANAAELEVNSHYNYSHILIVHRLTFL
jgi:ankyrin repeat protein